MFEIVILVIVGVVTAALVVVACLPPEKSASAPIRRSDTKATSKEKDMPGVGLTIGSDGVEPHLDAGGGVGIDLSDGSLTIDLGGGVKLDTDGSGIKFGL